MQFAASAAEALQAIVRETDPDVPFMQLDTAARMREKRYAGRRLGSDALGAEPRAAVRLFVWAGTHACRDRPFIGAAGAVDLGAMIRTRLYGRLTTNDWRLATSDWRLATSDWRLATSD